MADDLYTQCELLRELVDPSHQTLKMRVVAWIPASFAVPGKRLKIRLFEGWVDGWTVLTRYDTRPREFLDSQRTINRRYHEVLDA